MAAYRVQEAAERRLEEILLYTREHWGAAQAEDYMRGMAAKFADIAARRVTWRPIPMVGIVSILHERMHQIDRFRDDHPI